MLRVALVDVLLFLLPFVVYGAYMMVVRGQSVEQAIDEVPVLWLIGAGFALLVIAMVTLVSFSGGSPDAVYHPPVLENGVIKPGQLN